MLKPISRITLIKKFKTLGFKGPISGGKHQFMILGSKKIRIPNPHNNQDISLGLITEILRQAEISKEDWEKA
jgi:predicted RNA binding protein YcfA (HicA-like mRNA interferase family)